jgi:DNA-binding transcriptional LysR family regulator
MIDKLEYFLALARERNFGKAAESCGVRSWCSWTTSRSMPASPMSTTRRRVGCAVPFYCESYRLVTAPESPLGDRQQLTWAEVARVPLCLPASDMQGRHIIDRLLNGAGGNLGRRPWNRTR